MFGIGVNVWKGDLDYLRLFSGSSNQKIWEVKFFFNSLLAELTNHPYMAFPNLGPPLRHPQRFEETHVIVPKKSHFA